MYPTSCPSSKRESVTNENCQTNYRCLPRRKSTINVRKAQITAISQNENQSPPSMPISLSNLFEKIENGEPEIKISNNSPENLILSSDSKSKKVTNFIKSKPILFSKKKQKSESNSQSRSSESSQSSESPNSKTNSIKDLDLNYQIENFNSLKRFPQLSNQAEIYAFNFSLKIHLLKALKELSNELSVFQSPEYQIDDYCFKFLYSFFFIGKEKYEDFILKKDLLCDILFEELQNPAIIMACAIKRLNTFRNEIKSYLLLHSLKTNWSAELYFFSEKLIDVKNFQEFLETLEQLDNITPKRRISNTLRMGKSESAEFNAKELIFACLGQYTLEAERLVTLVKKWGNSPAEDIKVELTRKLEELALLFDNEKKIPSFEFFWSSRGSGKLNFNPISITPKEIHRSWYPDGVILFEKITINKKIIYEKNSESYLNQTDSEKLYYTLFKALCHEGLNPDAGQDFLEKLAKDFTFEINKNSNTPPERLTSEHSCFEILRATTVESMGFAFQFLLELFPGLFSLNLSMDSDHGFYINYSPGIICELEIESDESYRVLQRRRGNIFVADCPNQQIANLDITWCMIKDSNGWEGRLEIPNLTIINLNYWVPLVRILTSPQIDCNKAL